MYGLFGKMRAVSGQRDVLIGHLLHAAELLRDLEGCYLYVINSDPTDPDGIWVNEIWRSQDDHRASLTHEAVINLIAVARPIIADMPQRFEVTPLGGKGLPDSANK
jgi:quinol monooxygenase YgiN